MHKKLGVLGTINTKDEIGMTPLMEACQSCHLDVVKLLRNHGAYINLQRFDGRTALDIAISSTPPSQFGEEASIFEIQQKEDFTQLIQYLCQEGAQVNAQSKTGVAPLHIAAKIGNEKIVQILLANGALPDIQDQDQVFF